MALDGFRESQKYMRINLPNEFGCDPGVVVFRKG